MFDSAGRISLCIRINEQYKLNLTQETITLKTTTQETITLKTTYVCLMREEVTFSKKLLILTGADPGILKWAGRGGGGGGALFYNFRWREFYV